MSKYTTELRFICESLASYDESQNELKVIDVIDKAVPKIFDFDFPIFDESYRIPLCKKIVKHFYTREIGLETYGLWKLKLDTKLNEIMPYYNQMYKSTLLEFNPMYDVDITKTHQGKDDSNSTKNLNGNTTSDVSSTGSSDSIKRDLYSDTPQGALTGVESETYLTNARKVTDGVSTSSHDVGSSSVTNAETNVFASTDSYVDHIVGKQGSADYSNLLLTFRKTFVNIDMDVINALEDLFMMIW